MTQKETSERDFIGLHVDPALGQAVRDRAWETRKSVSQFVREAILAALGNQSAGSGEAA